MANIVTPTIVTVNATVTPAPAQSQLQQSGAVVSAGGTTLAANASQYCGDVAAVTAILAAPLPITSLAWADGTVTATAAAALALAAGETFLTTIAGAVPAAYNGTYVATVSATADEFTFELATNPGTETTAGTYTPPGSAFVAQAAQTFFAQGSAVGLYVLELGPQDSSANAIAALTAYIPTQSPQQFYAYLIDGNWDAKDSAGIGTLATVYNGAEAQTYFFVSTTQGNLSNYAANKAVFALVPSPTAAPTEVQAAAAMYQWLANQPGPASALAPMAYRYLYGVTPWARSGNAAAINAILSAGGNVILTGAEGGISTATLYKGTTMDGEQAAFWFGVDYFRIQVKQALAAAVIVGSNSQPPLLYSQSGINTLLAAANQVGSNAVAYGCASQVNVSAVPFAAYIAANSADYASGVYNGLSATLTGQSGFLTITFNLDAVAFQ